MTFFCEQCGQEHKTTEELEEEAGLKKKEKGNDADSLPAEPLPYKKKKTLKMDEYGDKY